MLQERRTSLLKYMLKSSEQLFYNHSKEPEYVTMGLNETPYLADYQEWGFFTKEIIFDER